jgi:hypothetical protein
MKVFSYSEGSFRPNTKGLTYALVALVSLLHSGIQAWAVADLIVNRAMLARTVMIEKRTFNAEDCAVVEGCMKTLGTRKLLRFSIGFCNIGQGDLVLGDPMDHPELYRYSPCHGHFHLKGLASYAILNSNGTVVRRGLKQAFCLLDSVKYLGTAGPSHGYNCGYQGLTRGWEDVYYRNLDCQWLDITGVPAGTYTLWVKVNPAGVVRESNYANNVVTVPVTIR